MGLSATNLQATPEKTASITTFLTAGPSKQSAASEGGKQSAASGGGQRSEGGGQSAAFEGGKPTGSESRDRGGRETGPEEDNDGGQIGSGEQLVGNEKVGSARNERGGSGGLEDHAGMSTGDEARRKTEVVARKAKRQRSPLRDWLAAAGGQRSGLGVNSIGEVDETGKVLERERFGGAATQSDAQKSAMRAVSEPAECRGTGADDSALQSGELGRVDIFQGGAVDGSSVLKGEDGAGVGEECEEVQLTLEEWVGDRKGTDSRSAAADPEGASREVPTRAKENENGVAGSAEVAGATGLFDRARSGDNATLPQDLRGELGQSIGAIEEKADSAFEWKGTPVAETATARQVRNRVEAPKSLEALWQRATVPRTDARAEITVEDRARGSRDGRNSTQSETRKRLSDEHVSDAREKMQKLWSRAPNVRDEKAPAEAGSESAYGFDWQEVDQSTLDELPLAIQAEIRSAQRLQMQRQQPKPAKKLEKAQHAQSIKPFFQRKSC